MLTFVDVKFTSIVDVAVQVWSVRRVVVLLCF